MDVQRRLCDAAERGDIGGIRAALADGASLEYRPGRYCPAEIAIKAGQWRAACYLMERGVSPAPWHFNAAYRRRWQPEATGFVAHLLAAPPPNEPIWMLDIVRDTFRWVLDIDLSMADQKL